MTRVKLYAICLVKNEDDVITQSLQHAAQFCEKVIVYDNGSTDQTWQIVNQLAKRDPRIEVYGQSTEPFHDGLRAHVFNMYKNQLSNEDWWLFLDADEFLAEDPHAVIEAAQREGADVINAWQIQFYYTEKDLAAESRGLDDRHRPISMRRQYYSINWQEPRLFRNNRETVWDGASSKRLPAYVGRIAKRRIFNCHYQFRDQEQIRKRLALRFGQESFQYHVKTREWVEVIRESRYLVYRRDGDPWRFTWRGLGYYYWTQWSRRIRWKCEALVSSVQRMIGLSGPARRSG